MAEVTRKLWHRAAQLYLANLVLVILFAFLEANEFVPMRKFSWRWGADWSWPRVFAFDQPYFLQILPRYSLFLLFTPLCLYLLRKRKALVVVLVSGAIYSAHLFRQQSLFIPYFESGRVGFHFAAWQLLFFAGIVIGWYREQIAPRLQAILNTPLLVFTAVACFVFVALSILSEFKWFELPRTNFLFGRPHLGPLRLLNVVVLFLAVYLLCTRYWSAISKYTGSFFITAGQNGLYIYLVHIPIIVLVELVVYEWLKWPKLSWWYTIPNIFFVAAIYTCARYKILFNIIPR